MNFRDVRYERICDSTREGHYEVLAVLPRDTPIERPEWEMMRVVAWNPNNLPLKCGLKQLLPFLKVVPRRLAVSDDFIELAEEMFLVLKHQ